MVMAGKYPESVELDKSNTRFVTDGKVSMAGFSVTGNNNLISGFTITNPNSNYGIRVTGNNNVFENNDVSNTGQDGIWFFGSDNKFIGNHIHDIVDRSKIATDPHVDCFQTWGPAENIIFEKNICDHTSTYGSNQIVMIESKESPVRNIIFRNNIFIMHDPGYSPMNFNRKGGQQEISNMYVLHNTIIHVNGMGDQGIVFRNITGGYVINNVFVDYGSQATVYIRVEGGSNIVINKNAVHKSDHLVLKGGILPGDVWISDPGFVNFMGHENHDFHLTASSPLIDAGGDVCGMVTDDFDGNLRPLGRGFDMGAYEYTAIEYKYQVETIQAEFGAEIIPPDTYPPALNFELPMANITPLPCIPYPE